MAALRILTLGYCLVAAGTLLVPPLLFTPAATIFFGQDAVVFYAVAQAALHGEFAILYDPIRLTALSNRLLELDFAPGFPEFAFKTWLYPPSALLFIVPLGLVPPAWFYPALEAVTALAAATAIAWRRSIGGAAQAAAILISPAACVNIVDGQCAFLSLALLIGGVRLLDENPILAGTLLGALSYKPQLFLLVPLALIGAHAWRALGSVIVTALFLGLLSVALFGIEPWRLWLDFALHPPSYFFSRFMEDSMKTGLSAFVCALLLGAPPLLAIGVQAVVAFSAAVGVIYVFRRRGEWEIRGAALLCGATVATPYLPSYDAILAAAAIAFWYGLRLADGFRMGELSLLAVLWTASAFNPHHFVIGFAVPVGLIALGALIVTRTSRLDLSAVPHHPDRPLRGRRIL
jgi:alpha-1,2-mannosyltransferase